jgi:hypothetical protein
MAALGRNAQALVHDQEAEQNFAIGKRRKLPEPTAPELEVELTGAQRAVEVLERELVQSGRRLFPATRSTGSCSATKRAGRSRRRR